MKHAGINVKDKHINWTTVFIIVFFLFVCFVCVYI